MVRNTRTRTIAQCAISTLRASQKCIASFAVSNRLIGQRMSIVTRSARGGRCSGIAKSGYPCMRRTRTIVDNRFYCRNHLPASVSRVKLASEACDKRGG